MSISYVTALGAYKSSGSSATVSNSLNMSVYSVGDLFVAVVCANKSISSVSTGWTEVGTKATNPYLGVYTRIADKTTDDDFTVTLSASGTLSVAQPLFRSTIGFADPSVKAGSLVLTSTAASSSTSYAAGSTMAATTADEFGIAIGGEVSSTTHDITSAIAGTYFTLDASLNGIYGYHYAVGHKTATNSDTPSVTFSSGFSSSKYIMHCVLKESAGSGSGIFWMGGA